MSLFHNDVAVRTLTGSVADGDTVTVLQAVSGGSVLPREDRPERSAHATDGG